MGVSAVAGSCAGEQGSLAGEGPKSHLMLVETRVQRVLQGRNMPLGADPKWDGRRKLPAERPT